MRRQNLLYYKNATLLKNTLSFFCQSVLQTSEIFEQIFWSTLGYINSLGKKDSFKNFLEKDENTYNIYIMFVENSQDFIYQGHCKYVEGQTKS